MASPPITRFTSVATSPHSGNPNNGLYVPELTPAQIANIPASTKKNGGLWYNSDLGRLETVVQNAVQPVQVGSGGQGNVVGPDTSTSGNIAIFNDDTGTLIADSGVDIARVPNLARSINSLESPNAMVNEIGNLGHIRFNDEASTIYVGGLTGVQFLPNVLPSETLVCSLFTGGLPSSSTTSSALVELQSDSGALLLSRMTILERNALSAPANGMLLFNTSTKSFDGFDGTNWRSFAQCIDNGSSFFIGTGAGNLTATGNNNSGIGILSLNALTSGINNTGVGNSSLKGCNAGSSNSSFGFAALGQNSIGNFNCAFGAQALYSNISGQYVTAVGYQALYYNLSDKNTGVGYQSLYSNTTGSNNTGLGYQSLMSNVNGNNNSAFGDSALMANIASGNSGFGAKVLSQNTTGINNSAFGDRALSLNISGIGNSSFGALASVSNTGSYNSSFGAQALYSNVLGQYVTAVGYQALYYNLSDRNTGVGYQSLYSNTIGSNNTGLGYQSLMSNVNGNNNSAFGDSALMANVASGNSGFGAKVLSQNTTGNNNSAFGDHALGVNISGIGNSSFGALASASTTGSNNSAFGYQNSFFNSNGSANSSLGSQALSNNTSGSFNTALGYKAGANFTVYNNSIFIGAYADAANNLINAVAIGYQASVSASNCMVLGGTGANQLFVGIGITPNAQLQLPTVHANRKIVLYEGANNDHQVFGLGTAVGIFRFQLDNNITSVYTWNAAASSLTSNELMRLTGTGFLGIGTANPTSPLQFADTLMNRKITLWGNSLNNDHQFYGFGTNASILRYQVDSTSSSHVFYAGVNSTTSKELMRLTGDGYLGIGTSSPTVAKLVVNGGVPNLGEESCIRAISATTAVKIELQNTATNGHLWEIRSLSSGMFDITDRTRSNTAIAIDTNGTMYAKQSFISMYASGSATTTTVSGGYVILNWPSFPQVTNNNYDISGPQFVWTGGSIPPKGALTAQASFTATHNGANGEITTFGLFRNGSVYATIRGICVSQSTSLLPITIHRIISFLSTSDVFDIRVMHSVPGRIITITEINFSLSST